MRADYSVVLDACALIPKALGRHASPDGGGATAIFTAVVSIHHGRGNAESYREVEHARRQSPKCVFRGM